MMSDFVLALHGGAGTVPPGSVSPERQAAYHRGLAACLRAGHAVLAKGGSALDAVTAAVMALEDDPLFNAGHGAVLTTDGRPEMDAAMMSGVDRAAGAVAGITGPRNPVLAARAVMEHSPHVLLIGEGALRFCRAQGLDFMPETYFLTPGRVKALETELARRASGAPDTRSDADRHGTVGAVARDAAGNLAAATSTGGLTAKLPGRVGDTPVIGAGTFADNATCAVSATGQGEIFIRYAAAHDISARIAYLGESLESAAGTVLTALGQVGGSGGLIAVDAAGNVAMPFNGDGMYRGRIGADGVPYTAIWSEALQRSEV
jgi:isoaspartyl peptidase/L-asparaginase-like protein (Ntn-hydrolase superfamily)